MAQTSIERHDIEDEDTEGDDDALTNLETVDARQDVDGVGAEHGQKTHVDVVQESQLQTVAKYPSQKSGNNNLCPEDDNVKIDIVAKVDDNVTVPVGGDIVDHQ